MDDPIARKYPHTRKRGLVWATIRESDFLQSVKSRSSFDMDPIGFVTKLEAGKCPLCGSDRHTSFILSS